jgi:hypothetical protein
MSLCGVIVRSVRISQTLSPMPDIIHESQGLKIVRNDTNRFAVVTLHYTADPLKRTPEWKSEAKAGMRPAQWAKEYEIDYTALYGQRVFPEISTYRDKIVVPEPYREYGPLQPFWAGFDFGQRNPTAFVVFTIDEGVIYAVWEHYEPCHSIESLCQSILSCPYYDRIKYIAADPTITNQKTRTNKFGAFVTLADLMSDYGVRKMIPGSTDEAAWVTIMKQHWKNPEDPTFRIWERCKHTIEEFTNAVYASQSDREILTQTYKEQMEDVRNHAMDATKYCMLSRPSIHVIRHRQSDQWRRWMK